MKYICKVSIEVIEDSTLTIPLPRYVSKIKVYINDKRTKSYEQFVYGVNNNKGILMTGKTDDNIVITYAVPEVPQVPDIDPINNLSNDEFYTKWKKSGFVEKFQKDNKVLNVKDYVLKAAQSIKLKVSYKGYSTNQVADHYDYVDEIIEKNILVDCLGFHSLFVALLRKNNIPAMLDIGFRLGDGDNPHVWAWYFDGRNWQMIDILASTEVLFSNSKNYPRVSLGLGTTHILPFVWAKDKKIGYIQYVLSDKLIVEGRRTTSAVFDSFENKSLSLSLIKNVIVGLFSYNDFLYLLQLDDYATRRYIKTIHRFLFRRKLQQRDTLKKTSRILFLKVVTILLQLFTLWIGFLFSFWVLLDLIKAIIWSLSLIPFILFTTPYFIAIANQFANGLYNVFKRVNIRNATEKIKKLNTLKVIMITGSYGKTTIKNFLYQLISLKYRTQMTYGNINTHAGIASWINQYLNDNTEYLIMEVDGYYRGEVKKICEMIPGDIVVITYLGDQHLQRLRNKYILAQTLKESVTFSKSNSSLHILQGTLNEIQKEGIELDERKKCIVNDISSKLIKLNPNLSKSNALNLSYAISIAEKLDISKELIEDAVKNISLPDRRQKISTINGFTVLDDSYSISYATAVESLNHARLLADRSGKKLLVVFAGIAELGKINKDSNIKYASELCKNADFTISLNSIFRKEIENEFKRQAYSNYVVKPTMARAINFYRKLYKPEEWIILLHPELTNLYY